MTRSKASVWLDYLCSDSDFNGSDCDVISAVRKGNDNFKRKVEKGD